MACLSPALVLSQSPETVSIYLQPKSCHQPGKCRTASEFANTAGKETVKQSQTCGQSWARPSGRPPSLGPSRPSHCPCRGSPVWAPVCVPAVARRHHSNRRAAGEGTWRRQRGPGDGPRLLAEWDALAPEQVAALYGPGVRELGQAEPSGRSYSGQGRRQGRRTRVGPGQAAGRWPGPPGSSVANVGPVSRGQRLPGPEAVTPSMGPIDRWRRPGQQ